MQFIKTILTLSFLFVFTFARSQSTYLPQGSKHQHFLDRLEIKLQSHEGLNVSAIKPLSRKLAVEAGMYADSVSKANPGLFTAVDEHNLRSLFMNNPEWYTGDRTDFESRRPVFNAFYKTKANFYEVNTPDFFLVVNPLININLSSEQDNEEQVFLNSKGVAMRGMIAGKVGFSAQVTDNQERGPLFMMQEYVYGKQAVPGVGFYKRFKNTGADYFDARGSIHVTAAKFIDISFGYDKNKIGNGYRSLFLSDFSNSYLFLKLNARVWKLNYQSTTMELTPQFRRAGDTLLGKKYASYHHLSVNVTRWLNIGLFETVLYGRRDHFDFTYLNPVMFLRAAEHQNGSEDNAIIGFDAKANIARKLQVYGQFVMDEFKLSEVKGGKGWWANKFGWQLGGKYIDAFGIPNLDLQGEMNFVRPFTYTHKDTIANMTHYNQPLAHPFGANFREFIAIARYQPHPKWNASARLIFWDQGLDTASSNYGGNIFKSYVTRSMDYGFTLPTGVLAKGVNAHFLLSWEPLENLFLDASALVRRYKADAISITKNTTMFTAGVRVGLGRREYDY